MQKHPPPLKKKTASVISPKTRDDNSGGLGWGVGGTVPSLSLTFAEPFDYI